MKLEEIIERQIRFPLFEMLHNIDSLIRNKVNIHLKIQIRFSLESEIERIIKDIERKAYELVRKQI